MQFLYNFRDVSLLVPKQKKTRERVMQYTFLGDLCSVLLQKRFKMTTNVSKIQKLSKFSRFFATYGDFSNRFGVRILAKDWTRNLVAFWRNICRLRSEKDSKLTAFVEIDKIVADFWHFQWMFIWEIFGKMNASRWWNCSTFLIEIFAFFKDKNSPQNDQNNAKTESFYTLTCGF